MSPTDKGVAQIFPVTFDCHQAVGSYTLATCDVEDILLESLTIESELDLSDDPNFTGVTVEKTPETIIGSIDGAKVNLGALFQVSWEGSMILHDGDAVTITIVGDSADVNPSNLNVVLKYRAVANGGVLV